MFSLFKKFLSLIFVFTLLISLPTPAHAETKSQCNKKMLVITVDELQWSKISKETTPFLYSYASKSYVASLTPGRVVKERTIQSTFTTINAGTRTFDAPPPLIQKNLSTNIT